MGVPYSKEIDAALNLFAPLAQKIRLILFLGIVLQTLMVVLLCLIFLAIIALIICVIPELSYEREVFVTPLVKRLTQRWTNSQTLIVKKDENTLTTQNQ
jgi:polyferredoxin